MPDRRLALLALGLAALWTAPAAADIDPASPTDSGWTGLAYPTDPDWADDQQTGIGEGDLVGDADHPAFYTIFDDNGNADPADDQIAFRVRLGADKNPLGFDRFFGVGMDADLDGDIDLFLGVDNTGSADVVGIWTSGTGANTSPSTTTIVPTPLSSYVETAANYLFTPVTATNDPSATDFDLDDDGDTDQFLTFVLPLADIAAQLGIAGFGPDSSVRYVFGTSTQPNALNQDLGGPNGGTTSTQTWEQLGAMSAIYTISGRQAPEPGTGALLLLGLTLLGARRR
jgi:hypothetical protein